MSEPREPCCAEWAKAHEIRTDSEGWGELAYVDHAYAAPEDPQPTNRTHIGNSIELPPVNYCPWCGAAKTK